TSLDVGAARRGTVPAEVSDVIAGIAGRLRSLREKDAGAAPTTGTTGDLPTMAASMPMRPIRIVQGREWEGRWALAESGDALVVERTWGFGSVTVVGFDPVKATETASAIASGAIWRAALTPVLSDALERVTTRYDPRFGYGYGAATQQFSINSGLERLA